MYAEIFPDTCLPVKTKQNNAFGQDLFIKLVPLGKRLFYF